jgi:hypothetical protein
MASQINPFDQLIEVRPGTGIARQQYHNFSIVRATDVVPEDNPVIVSFTRLTYNRASGIITKGNEP